MEGNVKQESEKKVLQLQKRKRYIAVTDDEGNVSGFFPLKNKNLGKDWVAMYQSALLTLAKWNLPNEQYRVMLALLSKVDFDNYLTIDQQNIADELGMKRPNVTKAIKALNERNILVEGPRAGLHKTYRLNPFVAHKGKNKNNTLIEFEDALKNNGKNILDADIR